MIKGSQLRPAAPVPVGPDALLAVDRAIADLRRGSLIVVRGPRGMAALALAAEMTTPDSLGQLRRLARSAPVLALTARRAAALRPGAPSSSAGVHSIMLPPDADDALVHRLADPTASINGDLSGLAVVAEPMESCAAAAVALTKRARLLPAALVALIDLAESEDPSRWARTHSLLIVATGEIAACPDLAAQSLTRVGDARVPLADAADARIIAFRPRDGGAE
ncbi:MAG: GTP cyclohydrolase II, partial [Alphaproteobacteria bacterium]|nr:GTP cyclohydrolase II [Alphaproteobacteria bacterium]